MNEQHEILKLLEDDCRRSPAQVAAMLGEEEAAVETAIHNMEKENLILGYKAMVDWDRTGEEIVTALIEVKVTPQRGDGFEHIAERIYQFDEVESLYLMSGAYDFTVIITGRTLKEVANFVSVRLSTIEGVIGTTAVAVTGVARKLEGVIGTSTHFILKKYKEKHTIFEAKPIQEERMVFC